jgi:hypothetical protein
MSTAKAPEVKKRTQEEYSAEGGLALAIGKIEASAWLLDQIEVGELGFLNGSHDKPACWLSAVEGDSAELAVTLQHLAIETIAREVQEIRRSVRVLCPRVLADEPATAEVK